MKSSLKKLRGLAAHHRNDSRERRGDHRPRAQEDELAQASQDMQDMRSCYDGLLSAAAAMTNAAYEFSESLKDLGTCLLEKTSLNDDEESGKVLLMMGKAQFELQKLVDGYRSHINKTISTPSESLLNELRNVEDMKRQCDEKREVFEYMLAAQREKGRSKSAKESFSPQRLQAAQEDYEEEATLFVFRLKSLKQGQSRSLLTQAARHHAAQLRLFRKGVKSLETIEPQVRLVAEKQHIDYQFSGLEDDGTESDDDYDDAGDGYEANDDEELSFDYGQNEQGQDIVSTSRNSMELDQADHATSVSAMEGTQETLDKSQLDLLPFDRRPRPGSQSAPIFPDEVFDPAERIEMRPSSTKKFHTYVLPTPVDCKSGTLSNSSKPVSGRQVESIGGWPTPLWHSSPLEPNKHVKNARVDLPSSPTHPQSILKESNIYSDPLKVPPPLAESLSSHHLRLHNISEPKKTKRLAFSGPLPSKSLPRKAMYSIPSPTRILTHQPSTSPRVSPSTSPPLMSSPKISELHELPRPPVSSANFTRPPSLIGHSAPLVSRGQEHSATSRTLVTSHTPSPLPTPPTSMARSFSIPSSGQRAISTVARLTEAHSQDLAEEIASPPLTPISLTSTRPTSTASESANRTAKSKGSL